MPDLDQINQFNQVLKELGSETEILAERSEEIEEIPPPSQELSEDIRELLEQQGEEGSAGEPAPAWHL